MKNILVSAYACSPIRGTEPGIGWSWALNLSNKKGYNVWCITNIEDRETTIAALNKLNLPNLILVFVELPFGIDRYLLNTSSKKIYLHYKLWQIKAALVAKQLHSRIHFDVAHHVTFGSLQQGTFLWKLKNVKLIFGPVGGGQEAPVGLKSYFGPSWKFEIIRSLISKLSLNLSMNLRNTLRLSSFILVTNKDTENLIKKTKFYRQDKVHLVIDNAIPISMQNSEFRNKSYSSTLKILWVGRMLPRKGLKLLICALSHVPDNIDYNIKIVGDGKELPSLLKWINEYKIKSERISIVGHVPFQEMNKYYEESDVFLFCSLRDSYGAQLTEAMSFGLPVIVLNIHGSASVPENCGIKINPTTKDQTAVDISKAIIKFSQDKGFLKGCSFNAFNYTKAKTWENKVADITSTFY